jgi:hypothetical protein
MSCDRHDSALSVVSAAAFRLSPKISVKAYLFFGEQWAISASLALQQEAVMGN